jgi:hypothetical protein
MSQQFFKKALKLPGKSMNILLFVIFFREE